MQALAALVICLFLQLACTSNPMAGIYGKLKVKDFAGAKQMLEQLEGEKPELEAAHFQFFVLQRYNLVQGDASQHDQALKDCIREYEWIAEHYSLTKNYQDMEGSIKQSGKADPLYEQAYQAMYSPQ